MPSSPRDGARSRASPTTRARSTRWTQLVEAQAYRLSFWRVAAEEINYRRFFDINSARGHPGRNARRVRRGAHRFLFKLVAEEKSYRPSDRPPGRPLRSPPLLRQEVQEHCARVRAQPLPDDGRGRSTCLAEKDPLRRRTTPRGLADPRDNRATISRPTSPNFSSTAEAEKSFSETYQRFIDRHVHFADAHLREEAARDAPVAGKRRERPRRRSSTGSASATGSSAISP